MIRDKRKIDAAGQPKGQEPAQAQPQAAASANVDQASPAEATVAGTPVIDSGAHAVNAVAGPGHDGSAGTPGDAAAAVEGMPVGSPDGFAAGAAGSAGAAGAGSVVGGDAGAGHEGAPGGDGAQPAGSGTGTGLGAELEAMRKQLDERLDDLQRLTAEYANYRKRVERDRVAMVEQAVGVVVTAMLPILDAFDHAKEHGELVGALAAVSEQLNNALARFGLAGFGAAGDAFDPTRHEAVAHETSAEVTTPTCVTVMRRGYLLNERMLRPALVAVADPA